MLSLYKVIWDVSGSRQIVLILLAFAIAALAAVPLNFQKDIINGLSGGAMEPSHLYLLCSSMVAAVTLSLGLKWIMGYRASCLGEDVIRLIRTRIYSGAVNEPVGQGGASDPGSIATIISSEAEELGAFSGSAFSEPIVQIGTLASVIGFIIATQPFLGAIAAFIILPQIVIVLQTQKRVNALVAERVRVLRRAIGKGLVVDFREFDNDVIADFSEIYETRRQIFIWKLSTKFALGMINNFGLVGILTLGGYLVIHGQTDVGTVVSATIGIGRIQGPSGFLIGFYRQVSATRVKYDLLREAVPG